MWYRGFSMEEKMAHNKIVVAPTRLHRNPKREHLQIRLGPGPLAELAAAADKVSLTVTDLVKAYIRYGLDNVEIEVKKV
jgi:hypothetical protein